MVRFLLRSRDSHSLQEQGGHASCYPSLQPEHAIGVLLCTLCALHQQDAAAAENHSMSMGSGSAPPELVVSQGRLCML